MFEVLQWLPGMGDWTREIEAAKKAADMWDRKSGEWFDKSGEFFKAAAGIDTEKKRTKEVEGLGTKLLGGIRDDFAKDRPIRREQNKTLQDINRKTLDPLAVKGPEYLDQTANMIGRAMESILGFETRDDTLAELVDLTQLANIQREEAATAVASPIKSGE